MSSSIRVLHVCESIKGGIASYLDEIGSLQLKDFGVNNVRFLVPTVNTGELPSIPAECLITIDYDRRSIPALASYTIRVARVLKEQEFDLVHVHSSFAGVITRVLRAAGVFKAPVVYCAHGWSFLMDVSSPARRIYRWIERALSPFADAIISISSFEHKEALRIGLPSDKCHLVYNGIRSGEQAQPVLLPGARINLLFSGRLDRQKGFDVLLNAMRQLRRKDIHLYVAGEGVLNRAESPSVDFDDGNVTLLGWIAREDLDAFYSAADALVMPSRWEGFGLAAIEAMRQSTAVIASDRGALPEIVVPGITGLLCPADNPFALAQVLQSLDKDCLRQWGKAGRARQDEMFSSSQTHRELCAIYSAVCRTQGDLPIPKLAGSAPLKGKPVVGVERSVDTMQEM